MAVALFLFAVIYTGYLIGNMNRVSRLDYSNKSKAEQLGVPENAKVISFKDRYEEWGIYPAQYSMWRDNENICFYISNTGSQSRIGGADSVKFDLEKWGDIFKNSELISIPINKITQYKAIGELHKESRVSGGGKYSTGGAIVGGALGGVVGSNIGGNKNKKAITTEIVDHDLRETIIMIKENDNCKIIRADYNAYLGLLDIIPEKSDMVMEVQ